MADVARGWMDCTGSTIPESVTVVAEDTCDINECMAFAGDVAFAGASPVVFAGDVRKIFNVYRYCSTMQKVLYSS